MQRISYFDQIFSTTNKDTNEIFSFLEGKAREATIVPFSVFSNLFHHTFNWHRFLESTLEKLDTTAPSSQKRNITYKIMINYSNLE